MTGFFMWQELWARRDRTALYLVPPEKYNQQEYLAHLLPHVKVIDWREEFLQTATPTQRYLNLSVKSELDRIRKIGDSAKRVFCLINNEYFLTRLTARDRQRFWLGLWNDFPHTTGIIVFSVLDTPELLPDKIDLENWRKRGRLFSSDNLFTEKQND